MAERRSLVNGVQKASDPITALENQFVFGDRAAASEGATPPTASNPMPELREGKGQPAVARVPITTRIRADISAALKRASLERQLNNQYPNSLQHILEESQEPWLRSNGYLQ